MALQNKIHIRPFASRVQSQIQYCSWFQKSVFNFFDPEHNGLVAGFIPVLQISTRHYHWLTITSGSSAHMHTLIQSPNWLSLYGFHTDPKHNTTFYNASVMWVSVTAVNEPVAMETYLQSHCLATHLFSGSATQLFSRYVTTCFILMRWGSFEAVTQIAKITDIK